MDAVVVGNKHSKRITRTVISREAPKRQSKPVQRRLSLLHLPWIHHLPENELREFKADANTLIQAADYAGLAQLITEWKATAEIYADPELFAELRTPENDVDL